MPIPFILLLIFLSSAIAQQKNQLYQMGDFEVRQLKSPGFDELPLKRKVFIYYLNEALESGRDISWKQLSKNGLKIRKLFEKIWDKSDQLSALELNILTQYYFKLLKFHMNYNAVNNQKFIIEGMTKKTFLNLLSKCEINPNNIPLELLSEMFDVNYHPAVEPTPDALKNFKIDGPFVRELKAIYVNLEYAKRYANPDEVDQLVALQQVFLSGHEQDLFLPGKSTNDLFFSIDYHKGVWSSAIYQLTQEFKSEFRTNIIKNSFAEFEKELPFKLGEIPAKTKNGFLLFADNYKDHNPYNLNLLNPEYHLKEEFHPEELSSFYLARYVDMLKANGRVIPLTMIKEFKEMLGHEAGLKNNLNLPPSLLEELRSDLVALYFMSDAKLLYRKKFLGHRAEQSEVLNLSKCALLLFFTEHIKSLISLENASQISDQNQLSRHIIFNYLLNSGSIQINRPRKVTARINLSPLEEIHQTLGKLLFQVQNLIDQNNPALTHDFLSSLGTITSAQKEWARDYNLVMPNLQKSKYVLYLKPKLVLKQNEYGEIIAVETQDFRPSAHLSFLFDHESVRTIKNIKRFRECPKLLKYFLK